jgi:hypothetical protein
LLDIYYHSEEGMSSTKPLSRGFGLGVYWMVCWQLGSEGHLGSRLGAVLSLGGRREERASFWSLLGSSKVASNDKMPQPSGADYGSCILAGATAVDLGKPGSHQWLRSFFCSVEKQGQFTGGGIYHGKGACCNVYFWIMYCLGAPALNVPGDFPYPDGSGGWEAVSSRLHLWSDGIHFKQVASAYKIKSDSRQLLPMVAKPFLREDSCNLLNLS